MYDPDTYSPHDIAPRDPDSCVVSDIVRSHLAEFLERVSCDTDGQSIPAFVQRELKALSECGDFTRGFLRLRCGDCRDGRIVPLAVGLCFREEAASAVIRLCMRVVFQYQRARSADDPNSKPHPGGIVWIQRFSDGGGAWLH